MAEQQHVVIVRQAPSYGAQIVAGVVASVIAWWLIEALRGGRAEG